MEALKYEGLSLQQRIDLGHVTEMPGFAVLRLLLEDACQQSVKLVIKLDPEDPNYDSLLKARQLTARVTNDVCGTLLKSIAMHSEAARIESAVKKIRDEDVEEARKPLGSNFGSIAIKPRKAAQQDNQ